MDVTAHGPEETTGIAESLGFVFGEDFALGQNVFQCCAAIGMANQPEQRLQIAQPAFAFFDVWLNDVTTITLLFMTFIALFKFGCDELAGAAFDQVVMITLAQIFINLLVAANIAGVQKGGFCVEVFFGETDAFIDIAKGIADFQAHIPHHVEHVLNDALSPWRLLVISQEEEVDVG